MGRESTKEGICVYVCLIHFAVQQKWTQHYKATLLHQFFSLFSLVSAYDRYVAICKSLHYMTIMDRGRCNKMQLGTLIGGFLHSIIHVALVVQLPFCGPNEIDHYFSCVHPVLKLTCTDTYVLGIVTANSGTIALGSFVILLISYTIILVFLRKQSAEGKRKALSTCGSHIAVVVIYFGPCTFMYMHPGTTLSEDKMVAVFYTIIIPMLSPLIYTLRNAEVKNGMKKLWGRRFFWEANGK